MNAGMGVLRKPIRTVLRWQLVATAVLTLAAGILAGGHGALSAALGGAVSVCAGWVSAVVASRGKAQSAGEVLFAALRAEGVKLGLAVLLLWVVLVELRPRGGGRADRVVHRDHADFCNGVFCPRILKQRKRWLPVKNSTPPNTSSTTSRSFAKPVGGDGGFWTIHVDSVVTAIVLGILGIGFLWWVVRGATAGVPATAGRRSSSC